MKESLGQKPPPPNPFFDPTRVYASAKQGLTLTAGTPSAHDHGMAHQQLMDTLLAPQEPKLPLLRP